MGAGLVSAEKFILLGFGIKLRCPIVEQLFLLGL